MNKLIKYLFIIFIQSPLSIYSQWHDWTEQSINNIVVENCSWRYSQEAYYQNPKSIQIDYNTNGSITFPYNYPGKPLTGNSYFLMSIYNPSIEYYSDKISVDFLVNGVAKTTWEMTTRRSGWNVYKVFQTSEYVKPYYYDFELPLSGKIPYNTTHIRIRFPNHSGSLYLGKLILSTEKTYKDLGLLVTDNFHPKVSDAIVPETPKEVSPEQREQIKIICNRIDEAYDVIEESYISKMSSTTRIDLYNRYSSYNISRVGNIVNGTNIMLREADTDYNNYRAQYGNLAFEIAQLYRNVQNQSDKNLLKTWYFDIFDYAMFVGGLFDCWEGGTMFTPSMFLMREELKETNRLTSSILQELRNTIGFDKVYLDHSFFIKDYMLYRDYFTKEPRPYEDGELGEDIDYLRLCSIRLLMSALFNHDEKEQVRDLKAVSHYFSDIAFQYSPGIHDGFKEDGTLNHHWGWLDNYGLSCLSLMPRIIYALSQTEFRILPQAHKIIYDQLISQDMRGLNGIIPATLTGKNGEVYSYGGRSVVNSGPYAFMALSGSKYGEKQDVDNNMASIFLRAYNNQEKSTAFEITGFEKYAKNKFESESLTPSLEPEGHVTYSEGLAMIHRRDNWIASIKGASKYAYARESGDPFITYMGYGMIEINNATWNRYGFQKLVTDFGSAGYDWRKLPGATTVDFNSFNSLVNKEYKRYWPNSTFAGGVNQDGNGLFTMKVAGSAMNNLGSFKANKSYFCFDNYIICLGSGISNKNSDPTITTLFQDAVKSNEKTYLDNSIGLTDIPYNYSNVLAKSTWLMNSHKQGYWIPSNEKLTLNRSTQTCPNWDNKENTSGTFATAYIHHGISPQNDNYWYINSIESTPEQMILFDEEMNSLTPPFILLRNDDRIQAVESIIHNTYGISVFDVSSDINIKDIISINRPAALMVKSIDNDTKILSIADPDIDYGNNMIYADNEYWGYSKPHEISIKLNGKWFLSENSSNVVVDNSNPQFSILTVVVRNGLTSTFTIKNVLSNINETKDNISIIYDGNLIRVNNNGITSFAKTLGTLYTSSGVLLKQINYNPQESIVCDVSDLLSGIYFFSIETDIQRKVFKFHK